METQSVNHNRSWYIGPCHAAKIDAYQKAQDSNPRQTKNITDAATITQIATLLDRLPTTGDIMVKMSEDASLIELTLLCQDSAYVIQFYNDRIKTPATSFFSEELPAERTLIDFLKLNLDNILPPL